nr:uncharacterized protein LOC111419040 [Onthophagus taurus]
MQKKKRRKGRVWVKPWIGRRPTLGASTKLLPELAAEDSASYKNHLQMTKQNFDILLDCVTQRIIKMDTHMRDALTPQLKLEVTLRYLATGDSFASLQYLYRVPKCTISNFIPEVCQAIYDALKDFIKVPSSEQEWKNIIQGFSTRWNFPNCAGALDGKHIILRSPFYRCVMRYTFHSDSEFYNYKGTFSIILLTLVDDQYCFQYIDVAANGRVSDGGIFSKSSLNNKKYPIPEFSTPAHL